ncbi:MAG: hypothetical protein QME81_08995 [bacterium]|nr:hypothetical protein [bacterium]
MDKNWIIKPICPDAIFTDREDVFDLFWKTITGAPKLTTISTAFVGLRRFGKSEIFRRAFNKAYFEQDKVVPIYYNFEGKNLVSKGFAPDYFFNFLRQYFGFLKKDPSIAMGKEISLSYYQNLAQELQDEGAEKILHWWSQCSNEDDFMEIAIKGPKLVTDFNENFIVVFLDEFQDVIKIRNSDGLDPDAVGRYQEAVEVPHCPHFITGSTGLCLPKYVLISGEMLGGQNPPYKDSMAETMTVAN